MSSRVESGSPAEAQSASNWPDRPAKSMESSFTVHTPVPAAQWDQVYRADPMALPTQSYAWGRAMIAGGRFIDKSRLYLFRDGRQVVVPLFVDQGLGGLLGRAGSQPAAWGFGGTIADHDLRADQLTTILDDLSRHLPMGIRLRPNPLHNGLWEQAAGTWARLGRTAHVLDLDGGFDEVWNGRFKPRTRTTIRKAEAAGVEIVSGNSQSLIDEFYGLFHHSVVRWAHQQNEPVRLALWRAHRRDPVSKFYSMAEEMGSGFTIWLARHRGQAVAAILVLQGVNAHYTRGAMIEELAGPVSANFLLHHRAIQAACAAGCRSYHMGETGNSAPLAQFKSRFGAVATPYAEFVKELVPVTRLASGARSLVKRAIGFRDA